MHFDNALVKVMELHKRFRNRREPKVIPKVSSVGEELHHLEKDRSISTDPTESRKRRTIRLIRSNSSWGFTLQTYGIRHKKTNEIEITTYVDYVEIDSPAWISGMRRGDVILSVNGESVEQSTHQQLVEKIKACTQNMRLVVLFEDCCRKVELHDRYIKLKKVLKEKRRELRLLEEQEHCILQGVTRMDCARLSCRSSASSLDSTLDRYSLIRPSSMGNMPTTSHFPFFRTTDSDTTNSFYSEASENGSIFGIVGVDLDSDTHSCASSVISSGAPDCVMPETPLGGSCSGSSNSVMENESHLQVGTQERRLNEFEQELYTMAKDSVGEGLADEQLWQPQLMMEGVVPPPLLLPDEHINEKDEITRL